MRVSGRAAAIAAMGGRTFAAYAYDGKWGATLGFGLTNGKAGSSAY